MKKSVLALGAAVVAGGLGFAGAAHAVAYFGAGSNPAGLPVATDFRLNPGHTGHMLYLPYYTAQGANSTLLNITNTDTKRGKVVKVRFRGAANSDDVLDFTVLLSPGDVWTATVSKGDNGYAYLTSSDSTCTLPTTLGQGASFKGQRLPAYASDAVKQAHTREGYMEVLNMADVPEGSDLYKNIKHVKGVPGDCAGTAVQNLISSDVLPNAAAAAAAGLVAPSGQLTGWWAVLNQEQLAVYSGVMTAIQAVDAAGANGVGNVMMAPQTAQPVTGAALANTWKYTSDPLLRDGGSLYPPLWFDLPDMSTPLVAGLEPHQQADQMATQVGRLLVANDYLNDAAAAVPLLTDWVVSQPTRRYFAAVDYAGKIEDGRIFWNADMHAAGAGAVTTTPPALGDNRYGSLKYSGALGYPFACMQLGMWYADREENFWSMLAETSPGEAVNYCGEVFTMSFGGASVLNSTVSNVKLTPRVGTGATVSKAGWGALSVTVTGAQPLPLVGFAATSAKNTATNVNYGMTLPYRWAD